MLVPDLNIFFIHIPKCAGVSVEMFFLERDGLKLKPKHIVGQLTDEQRAKYRHGDYLQKTQNVTLNGPAQHFTGPQARKYVPEYNDCYSFAIVRNPWDRMVSEFLWQQQTLRKPVTFKDVVNSTMKDLEQNGREASPHSLPQWMFTHNDKGDQVVKEIFRMEKLDDMVARINAKFPNLNMKLKKANATNRSDKKDYKQYYNDDLKSKVDEMFAKDIEIFKYSYD